MLLARVRAKADHVVDLFASGRFDDKAMLFAYRASETGAVLAQSRHDVSAALRRLSQRIGKCASTARSRLRQLGWKRRKRSKVTDRAPSPRRQRGSEHLFP